MCEGANAISSAIVKVDQASSTWLDSHTMTTEHAPLPIEIRPAEESALELLRQRFDPNSALNYHRLRFDVQRRGEGIYLIAWHRAEPIGHFLLRWSGPDDDPTGRYPRDIPYLEAGATVPEFQRRGVATRLVQIAEDLVRERGNRKIGLAVGHSDNPAARRLYERLGYQDWGQGEFTIQWHYEALDGRKGVESEVCVYLFKTL